MLKSGKRAKQKQLTTCMLVIFHTVEAASFGKSSGLGVVAILSLVSANSAARKQQFELWHTWIYLAREIVALLSSNKQVLWESCRLLWGQVPPWHWNQGQSTLFMASHLINLDRPQSRMGNRKWWRTIWSIMIKLSWRSSLAANLLSSATLKRMRQPHLQPKAL